MKNKGFTLIELIVVMAIIAVLVLLAAPRFLGYTKDAKVTAMEQDTKILSDVVELYHLKEGEWPIIKDKQPVNIGLGGVDAVYLIDENKVADSVKNINRNYSEYGVAVQGKYKGMVFHLDGVTDSTGTLNFGNNKDDKKPIVFEGVAYEDIGMVPRSPFHWFEFEKINGGYQINGFTDNILELTPNGTMPTAVAFPSKYKGEKITSIKGDDAWGSRTFIGLNEVVLPRFLENIGGYAFYNNNLTDIVIPESVTRIGTGAFYNNNLTELHLPNGYLSFGLWVFNDNQLPEEQAFIYSRREDGSIDYSHLVSYGGISRHVVVPDTIKTIGRWAMRSNKLQTAKFPDGLKVIGDQSMRGNNLEAVTIPNSVERIESGAFYANRISKLTLPDTTKVATFAFNHNELPDEEAFIFQRDGQGNINKEMIVSYGGGNRVDVVIPDGVKTIPGGSMNYNRLNSVIIPSTVHTIHPTAFNNNGTNSNSGSIQSDNYEGRWYLDGPTWIKE